MKFFIETYGCQMNLSDSFEVKKILKNTGLSEAEKEDDADVVIINTCSVRNTAEERVLGRLGYFKGLKSKKPNLKIYITGCMAQSWGHKLFEVAPHIDGVFGTYNRSRMISHILNRDSYVVDVRMDKYEFLPPAIDYQFPFKASVTVIHGCNHSCTYCIVPKTRGKEVSRPIKDIIDDIRRLVDEGVVEVLLLGQNINSYGRDIGTSFKELLTEVNKIEGLKRIRFLTSHPINFKEDLIDRISELDKVCRYFHLPVQSGSNRILKLMKRGYTYEYYVKMIEYVRNKMPDASISTDIIVGFPSETEEDFNMTLNLVNEVRFDFSYMFIFNPKKGTPAETFSEQVPEDVKVERIQRLIKLQHSISKESNLKDVGKEFEVLVEERGKYKNQLVGRTEYNKVVAFEGDESLIGKFVKVRVEKLIGNTLIGSLLQKTPV
ncbi:MAG: tRNA (N6-isopentenyl adenosine(37)-C2)-methylthiotransferase MiaB [Brevinematales bacterium]|nr:tRNA (N6-isopentenyl adenosine(37)-C2)-methylthiotransferase MiaB [Brevinematales bacterium]